MASNSENAGSDNDTKQTYYCDICRELENEFKSAEGYCTDCLEYLCAGCFHSHCKPRPMRDHKLVRKDKMPQRQVSADIAESKCECNGKDNDVNFYCEKHQKLLCVNCIAKSHKECSFLNLSEYAKDTEQSKDYTDVLKELDKCEELFKRNKDISYENKEKCNESFKQVFQDIDFLKKRLEDKMIAVLTIEREAEKARDEYTRKMQNIEQTNGHAVSDVRLKREDLTTLKDIAKGDRLFVALQRSKSVLNELKSKMDKTNTENVLQSYTFIPNDIMKNMLTNETEVGKLIQTEKANGSLPVSKCSAIDYPEYGLPKCLALSEKCVVVIDYIHSTLQKVNDENTVAQIKLSSGPWDIANVSCTRVVVSQPSEEKVAFINLENDTVRIDKEIKVNCRCEGLAYTDDKIFIASSCPACIVVYNTTQAAEENRILTDEKGCPLFLRPAYIDVHPQKHLICLSDRVSSKVFILHWTGALSEVFESDDMKMPLIVAFRNETVVVVGFESNTINIISFETKRKQAIETRYLKNIATEKLFKDSTFKTNSCWKYCAGKYFTIVCKSGV